MSKMLLALGGHLLPPSVGPHAGLRPGWSGAPSHSAPKLPNLPPPSLLLVSASVPTLFYAFLYGTEIHRGEKLLLWSQQGFLLTATDISSKRKLGSPQLVLLFHFYSPPLACFSFYLHFTRSVYVSLMLAISLERFQFERQ